MIFGKIGIQNTGYRGATILSVGGGVREVVSSMLKIDRQKSEHFYFAALLHVFQLHVLTKTKLKFDNERHSGQRASLQSLH